MTDLVVVGIGADGWEGLSAPARTELMAAEVLFGGPRQLDLVPLAVPKVAWRTPLLATLREVLDEHEGRRRVVLASGDPMLFGIGTTLSRWYDLRVFPQVSSVSLACARQGWAVQDVQVVSLVGRPIESLLRALHEGAQVLVLSEDGGTPGQVAELLTAHGFGASELAVWSQLGGPAEACELGSAASWAAKVDPLNVVALTCHGSGLPDVPGLPEEAFDNDGQITKREVRAVVLALLAPEPGRLLWDVGAGTGSVGIEWARAGGRTVAVERAPDKCQRISRNAASLGVPAVTVVAGEAPQVLEGLASPDAVFVGGGATTPGLLEACWSALSRQGRLVVTAVTVESEAVLLAWQAKYGGELLRLSVQRTAPVGTFTGWKPMTTVTVWSVTR